MTYSATALVLLPGRLATAMPRAVAARHRNEVEADAVTHDGFQARGVIDDVVGQFGAHDDPVGFRRPFAQGVRLRVGRHDQPDMRRQDRLAIGVHRIGQQDDRFLRHRGQALR